MTPREKHLAEIARTKNEIEGTKPGPHRRDLVRRLVRMERDLKQYDLYRAGAERHGGAVMTVEHDRAGTLRSQTKHHEQILLFRAESDELQRLQGE